MKPRAFLLRAAVFALLWWALAEGRMDSWGVGVVSVLLAAAISLILSPSTASGLAWRQVPGFAWFFLRGSFIGGLQVAWLAFRPTDRLAPALLALPLRLPPGPQRVLFVNTLNLLPGTLGVELEEATLHLHVLGDLGAMGFQPAHRRLLPAHPLACLAVAAAAPVHRRRRAGCGAVRRGDLEPAGLGPAHR